MENSTAQKHWNEYAERMARVTDYLREHLDDPTLDLNRLAEVACLSPYHWHRIYTSMRGETLAATVKRLRLHRAAGLLANSELPVATVAKRSGYPNLQSFTRIFGATYGMPPAEYRLRGSHSQYLPDRQQGDNPVEYPITIRKMDSMTVAGVPHRGPYMEIGRAFDTLFQTVGQRGLIQPGTRMMAIYYDDPTAVPPAELKSAAAILPPQPIPVEPPLEQSVIPGGEHAVLRHQGPYAGLAAAYQWLYGQWLPKSGRQAADAPVFEEYLNSPRDTPPAELLTEIFLPLR